MTRTILTVVLITLLNVLVGCTAVDSGKAQLLPSAGKTATAQVANATQADIIEQVTINRRAYRRGLESLIAHYKNTGNNMMLTWAENELKGLDDVPQYNYVIEAIVAGPNLKASTKIAEAELIYREALQLENKARQLVLIRNEDLLRQALGKYNQLIRKHPSSDRIDDAAYHAGGIYEHFKDYTIALLYYQRAYQWNPKTTSPARYKAAYVLDVRLHRRLEALQLYQQAVQKEDLSEAFRDFAEKRIAVLTKSDETVK